MNENQEIDAGDEDSKPGGSRARSSAAATAILDTPRTTSRLLNFTGGELLFSTVPIWELFSYTGKHRVSPPFVKTFSTDLCNWRVN